MCGKASIISSQVSNPSLSETLCFSVWECRAKCAYSVWCVRIGRRPLHATVFKGRFCTLCTGAVSHPSHKGPFPLFSSTPRGAFLCKSFMWGSQCISNIRSIENLPPLCVLDLCQPMPSSTNSKNTYYVRNVCNKKPSLSTSPFLTSRQNSYISMNFAIPTFHSNDNLTLSTSYFEVK